MKDELKQKFENFKSIMESATTDFEKFIEKGNSAAGTRVRKNLMEMKKLAHEIRAGIQEVKHTEE